MSVNSNVDHHSGYEHIVTRLVEVSTDGGKRVAVGKGQADTEGLKHRYLRRRVGPQERDFIWASTNGNCYLCKKYLPRLSPWHVEHVVAFAKEPGKNDVLGNMLASCEKCNLTKSTRSLKFCIEELDFDVATFALEAGHLNTAARTELLNALNYKHQHAASNAAQARPASNHGKSSSWSISDAALNEIMTEIELKVSADCQPLTNTTVFHFSEAATLRQLERNSVEFDEENAACVSFGSYGRVFQGTFKFVRTVVVEGKQPSSITDRVTHEVVCAIKIPSFSKKNSLESFRREVETFSQCQHPNIVKFYGWILVGPNASSKIGIVMEYCTYDLGDLRALKSVNPMSIFAQVADALQFMHEQSIVHRDVKLNNILIRKNRDEVWSQAVAKLCDLGSAKMLSPEDMEGGAIKHTNTGTAGHKPPEIRRGVVDFRSDIYSLGKTMKYLSDANTILQSDRYCFEAFSALFKTMVVDDFQLRPHAYMVANELRGMNNRSDANDKSIVDTAPPALKSAAKHDIVLAKANEQKEQIVLEKAKKKNKNPQGGGNERAMDTRSLKHEQKADISATVEDLCQLLTANQIDVEVKPPQGLVAPLRVAIAGHSSAPTPCYILPTAGCRENPRGKCKMSYHAKLGCSRSEIEITVTEAEDFKHKPCSKCFKP